MQHFSQTYLIILIIIFFILTIISLLINIKNKNLEKLVLEKMSNKIWSINDTLVFFQHLKEEMLGFSLLGLGICVWLFIKLFN